MARALVVVALFALVACVFGAELCAHPDVSVIGAYSSTDLASAHEEAVFVAEFRLKCAGEDVKDAQLHAVVNGKVHSVALGADGDAYQVSWTARHDDAPKGTYSVEFFDDEGFSNYLKARRSNENVAVAPRFTIPIEHKGVSNFQFFVSSQFVALVGLLAAFYFINSKRAQL